MTDIRVKILVFQHDGTVVSQYLLGEGVHIIGRDPNSAIYVESEYISNEHAKLHLTDEGIFIEDLNSTSGTFLDDVTVRGKLRLNPDQRLKVGDLYIDLQLEGAGDLSPGVKIGAGRYQLVKELGRGAMGQVWLGQDTQLDEYVAIKVLNSDVAKDAVSLLDLKREVQKSRKLSHDNIIRIHDLVQLPGENPFISLEYVEGTDLHAIQLNQPDRIFQWAEVKPYVLQLCEALDYAHERKIVHRDLKPPNIMIAKDGVLKLADFGIAASIVDATGRSSMANIISGTPQFMSPQQMLGKSPKASDDIYALGATIYDLLTGRPPFHTGDIAQQVHHVTPAPIEQRLAEFGLQNPVPDYVNSVVLSCLAKNPEARPTSAGAIAEWIRTEGKSDSPAKRKKTKTGVEKITPEEPIQAEAETPAPVEAQPQEAKGKKTPVLAIAAVAAIAVIAGVLFLGKSGDQNENQNQGDGPQAGEKGGTEGQPATAAQMQAKLKDGLVAYYPFNGNANDESSNGNDGEVKGATLTVDRHGNSKSAYKFDGENDYLMVPHQDSLNIAEGLTLSTWVRHVDLPGAYATIIQKGDGEQNAVFLLTNTKGRVRYFWLGKKGGTVQSIITKNVVLNPNILVHLAVTHVSGSQPVLYVNGILHKEIVTQNDQTTPRFANMDPIYLGADRGARAHRWYGEIDDVRIYNRALSADEITALYDLEKPKTDLKKGLVAYYPFNGNAKDESGKGHDGEVKGATLSKDRHNADGKAYSFDGKSWIELPQSENLKFGANDFTYCAWFNTSMKDPITGRHALIVSEDNNRNALRHIGLNWVNGYPRGQFAAVDNARRGAGSRADELNVADSRWHQLIGIRSGSTFKVAIDGKIVSVEENSEVTSSDAGVPVRIGARAGSPMNPFLGLIDDVRIYNRALSAGEVAALYDLEKPSSEALASAKIPGTLLWEFKTGNNVSPHPAIGPDGTVYVGSVDKKLYALDPPTGAKKWEFDVGKNRLNSPLSIAADGTVYVGSMERKVFALNGKNGAKIWEFETGVGVNNVFSSAIGSDDTLYVGSLDKKLHALDGKTGAKKWEFETGDWVWSSPAIGTDGTVYFGSDDRKVYALNGQTGAKIWEFIPGNIVRSSPSIGADGTLYIGSYDSRVYALDGKTGAKKWEFKTGHEVESSPAIGPDGTVYIGSRDRKVYALDGKTGAKKWEFETGEGMYGVISSPAIGDDGTVYIGSSDKKFYALNGQTGVKQWEFETKAPVRGSPVIGADGTIYIGSHDSKNGILYAFASSSKGPAKSPWPMFGQNAQHTGRASASSGLSSGDMEAKEIATIKQGTLMTWSPDGGKIAGWNQRLTVWDSVTGAEILQGTNGQLSGLDEMAWGPKGIYLATASRDGKPRIWIASTGKVKQIIMNFEGGKEDYYHIAWSPQGDRITCASPNGTVHIKNFETNETIHRFDVHGDSSTNYFVAWAPDGKTMAVIFGRTIQIWDVENGKRIQTAGTFHDASIGAQAWSRDGKRLAIGCRDGTALILDGVNYKKIKTLKNHQTSIVGIDWSPDGNYLATGDDLGTLTLWHSSTGRPVQSIATQKSRSYTTPLKWSPKGDKLFWGKKIWQIGPKKKPTSTTPNSPEAAAAIEAAIRKAVGKPTGTLTKADLGKVTGLNLNGNQISDLSPLVVLKQLKKLHIYENRIKDVSALAGLKQLEQLNLRNNQIRDVRPLAGLKQLESLNLQSNPDLTKAQIAELQKALPKCNILHNATK